MTRMGFLLLLFALPALAQPVEAQAGGSAMRELQATANRVASQWNESGVNGLGDLLVERGIGLHTEGSGRETLDPRKALAALGDLLSQRRTTSSRVERVTMAGAANRGSAEIAWEAMAPGTTEVLRYTVFIAFQREEAGWLISEIRVLP